jgi:hypothetical protein
MQEAPETRAFAAELNRCYRGLSQDSWSPPPDLYRIWVDDESEQKTDKSSSEEKSEQADQTKERQLRQVRASGGIKARRSLEA